MKVRSTAAWIAVALAVAACGGADTAGSGDGDTPPPESAVATAAPSDGDPSDGESSAASGPDQPGNGTVPPGGGSDATGELIGSPPPDPSEMTPTDEPPDHTWMLYRALATVTAGGLTVEFLGLDPIWLTESTGRPLTELTASGIDTLAGCSVLQTGDGQIIAQTSFHHPTERSLHSSFSMSDNGDGTVTWGLYHHESGEEWSATGPGAASISYLRLTDPEEIGYEFDEISEELYVLIDFEGEASENLSTDKSQASSRVLCHYIPRPN